MGSPVPATMVFVLLSICDLALMPYGFWVESMVGMNAAVLFEFVCDLCSSRVHVCEFRIDVGLACCLLVGTVFLRECTRL